MISVVIRPFKSGGVFYPAGTIIEPAGFKLYKSRLGEGKISKVDEHNLEEVARYLSIRHGVEDAKNLLTTALKDAKYEKEKAEKYLAKVTALAEKYEVAMEGRELEDVVAEVKQKIAEAKAQSETPNEDE